MPGLYQTLINKARLTAYTINQEPLPEKQGLFFYNDSHDIYYFHSSLI